MPGVWIGAGATILPGVTVWENAVVGAGSVVTHDVEPNTIVTGNPAKLIRRTSFTDSMMENIIEILHNGQHSLVVYNGDIQFFDGRGIADLYVLLKENSEFLHGAFLADKVVGKAAAALMVLAGVKEMYADVISVPALDLLIENKVHIRYGTVVPHVINRTGTGCCPLETRCRDCLTPQECFNQIEEFIELQNNK